MPTLRAVAPAAAATSVVLLAGFLYGLGYREQYYALAEAWGAAPFRTPFLDMHAVTAAVQCHRMGFDVYVQNPCDVFGRVHGYSPLWLWLAVLPITTAWDNALGLGLVLLFLVSLAILPPGRDWPHTALITLGAVSSATMFALERANVDLLMFVMAMLAVRLRTTGYAVSLFAGMLKFYPIVLLVLAVRERPVTCLVIWAVAACAVAVWFALDGIEVLRGVANIPSTHPFDDNVFGARNLPFGVAELAGLSHAWAMVLQVLLLAIVLGIAVKMSRRVQVHALTDMEREYLLAGSVLLVGCFVMAQNVSYRGIYLLFVLPVLVACWRGAAWLILLLMWNGALRPGIDAMAEWPSLAGIPTGFWLLHELAWWGVITLLAALLLRLVWESPAVAALRRRSVAAAH
jgi:hypothetical protein